ncbi:hypothetical protein [Nocardia sp. NBC_00416]|uniref:hypothetical protein n=1 Tax=Nocardia sp. NBC_00416 TaxID=2975991 RepID=UPI002E23C204
MDIGQAAEIVAATAATGVIAGLSEDAARSAVTRVRQRIRAVFESHRRETAALDEAIDNAHDSRSIREFTRAIDEVAALDADFSEDLITWARKFQSSTGTGRIQVKADRDAYTSGGDMTFNQNLGEHS